MIIGWDNNFLLFSLDQMYLRMITDFEPYNRLTGERCFYSIKVKKFYIKGRVFLTSLT